MTLLPGTQLDRYTIEAFLGEGAMGKVYRAFDARLERAVAIKVLEVEDGAQESAVEGSTPIPEASMLASGVAPVTTRSSVGAPQADEVVASALREARAAAAILHPNATAIFDADRTGDTSFIVMELVPGTSLRRFVGEASVPLRTRIRWLVDVAGALAAAHHAGVVHRDVKPENVIVRDDGLVKVLDFGIARLPRRPTETFATLTSGGGLLGTPAYMAPEQIRGEPTSGAADQFAWGVLAYELMAGRLPWEATGDPIALLAAVLSSDPSPLADVPDVPLEVAAAVHRALAKAPADRFPSMNEAAAALSPFAGARRPLRRTTPPNGQEAPPSSSAPSSPAIALGFSEQIAPFATSVMPPDPGPEPLGELPVTTGPPLESQPFMRTLPSTRSPGEILHAPDFSAPVDVDAHLALLPPEATCKGIFFLDLLRLGATAVPAREVFGLAGLAEQRYMGFHDYPAVEYVRLAMAVALAVHGAEPLGEALRRIGQRAFATASGSLVGKTLFGVFGRDLEPLLFTAPRAYRLFLNFGEVTVEKTGQKTFRCRARDLPAFLETYQVGVIEGVLRHCGARARLRIAVEAPGRATIEIELI